VHILKYKAAPIKKKRGSTLYNYTVKLREGENMFRLKQADNDGRFTLPPILLNAVYDKRTNSVIKSGRSCFI
jgi:hypothetical protein